VKALKPIISITLLFAYLLSFGHTLTPHCESNCDGAEVTNHVHQHEHHHGIEETNLEHDDHVAHGDHSLMREALRLLDNTLQGTAHIMAGNVATLEGFNRLADWGANSIRVGIGGGSICSTRIQTGHGVPTLQSIIDCARTDRDAILVADGGIKNSGDIVKALAAGADVVMLGSLLAGTDETPSETFRDRDGRCFKAYRGMASAEAQKAWRGKTCSLEGVSTTIPCKGSVKNVVEELLTGVRSGLSYSGARDISELQSKARFILQSHAASIESSTHILRR